MQLNKQRGNKRPLFQDIRRHSVKITKFYSHCLRTYTEVVCQYSSMEIRHCGLVSRNTFQMRVNFCLFHTVDEEKTTTTKRQNWVFRTFELIFLQNVQRRVSTSQWNPSNYTKHLTTQERLELRKKKSSLEAAFLFVRNMNYSTKLLGKSATHTTTIYVEKTYLFLLLGSNYMKIRITIFLF